MNLAAQRLTGDDVAEELDKGGTGVARHGLAEHLAGLGIERGEQRQHAMAVVLEPVPFGAPRRQRQHRDQAIEGLNRRFLVHGEHRGVLRRIEIQPDHIGGFLFKVRIVRPHVALEPMRLQAGPPPRFRDQVVMDAEQPAQFAGAPMRAAIRRTLPRLRQNARFHRRRQNRRGLAAIPRLQARHAVRQKAPSPAIDVVAVARHRGLDRRVRCAVSQHQNDARAARVLRADLETANASFQFGTFIGRQCQRHIARHGTSTTSMSTGH